MDDTDLKWYLSATGASEGGAKSGTEIPDAVDEAVFPDASDSALLSGGDMTRKVFVVNTHGVDTFQPHSIWVLAVPREAVGYIGLGFNDADDDADGAVGTLVDFSTPAQVALLSDGADTRNVDLWGLVGTTPTLETVALSGADEVLSVASFTHLLAVHTTISASRTLSVLQGSGGTQRGMLAPGIVNCFRWLSPADAKSTGMWLPAIGPSGMNGIWAKIVWPADTGAVQGNVFDLKTETLA